MEAAALYAYATARRRALICLAHVTNTMAATGEDFEKGHANGAHAALTLAATIANALLPVVLPVVRNGSAAQRPA